MGRTQLAAKNGQNTPVNAPQGWGKGNVRLPKGKEKAKKIFHTCLNYRYFSTFAHSTHYVARLRPLYPYPKARRLHVAKRLTNASNFHDNRKIIL